MRKTEAPGHQNNRFVDRNPPSVPIGTRITADTMNDLQDELMGIQDEANLPEAIGSQKQVLKAIREIVYPVGYTYAQYPSGKTPGEMKFPGVWVSQFETEGVFFRTPGGNASSFTSTFPQAQSSQSHSHKWTDSTGGIKPSSRGGYISGTTTSEASRNRTWNASGVKHQIKIDGGALFADNSRALYTDKQTGESGEIRPKNRTFRVWRRTA